MRAAVEVFRIACVLVAEKKKTSTHMNVELAWKYVTCNNNYKDIAMQ